MNSDKIIVVISLLTLWICYILLSPYVSHSFEVSLTGVSLQVEYTEPEVNDDESVLGDLEYTTVKWKSNGDSGVFSGSTSFPASSVGGGGVIEAEIKLPVLEGEEVILEFWATATDDAGNEGIDSEHVVKEIDKLAPGPPK